jgi:cytoskeletal protein CcmA (bactofilin family)
MKMKFWIALLVALVLALSITPVWASGPGYAAGDCYGGTATVQSGEHATELNIFGCSATVKSGGTVDGDASVFGGNLIVEKDASINGELTVFGGNVVIDGHVSGDISVVGGQVSLGSTAEVDGSITTMGGHVDRSAGAVVKGDVTNSNNLRARLPIPLPPFRFLPAFAPVAPFGLTGVALRLLESIITAVALAALGVLIVVLFPQPTRRVMNTAQTAVMPSFGVGCLTFIVVPVVMLILILTLVGPFIVGIVLAAAVIFGWIAIGYLAGERILEGLKVRDIIPVIAVIVGVGILALIGQVPCLGWTIGLLIATLGLGAVILTRFGTRPYPFTPAMVPLGPMTPISGPPAPIQSNTPTLNPGSEISSENKTSEPGT